MNTDQFFAEAKRLNLRMLGTPEETRAALDAKDAEIARLRTAGEALIDAYRERYKRPTNDGIKRGSPMLREMAEFHAALRA